MTAGGPRMRRTRPADLALALVIVGGVVYLLLRKGYDALPPLSYFVPIPLALLGVWELALARRVRAAVRHEPRSRPMAAIAVARAVALAKASSLVGAGVLGAALALVGRVAPHAGSVSAAAHDLRVGLLAVASCVLLTAAGLLLERAAVDPHNDERKQRDEGRRRR